VEMITGIDEAQAGHSFCTVASNPENENREPGVMQTSGRRVHHSPLDDNTYHIRIRNSDQGKQTGGGPMIHLIELGHRRIGFVYGVSRDTLRLG
jgi:hypothetical protein